MKITVIGMGRLGLPYLTALAELGHDVLGVDINAETLDALRAGRCPFDEPSVTDYIAKHTAAGRMRFTDSYDEAVAHGEVFFLAVATPQLEGAMTMDLSAVEEAIVGVARRLTRDAVLIGKSTVPVGFGARLAARASAAAPKGVRLRVGWSPDFLREALSMETSLHPARLVLGSSDADRPVIEGVIRRVWGGWLEAGVPLLSGNFVTADLTKAASNAFLSTKMSFANLVDDICQAAGADFGIVSRAMALDQRIGPFGLTAGLGWGGSCLGKDIRAFADRAQELGESAASEFLTAVDSTNTGRRLLAVEHTATVLPAGLKGAVVAVWGASFKPSVGDISDSPALDVALRLHRAGAEVRVHDPSVNDLVRRHQPELTVVDAPAEALIGAGVLIVATDWPRYTALDPASLADSTTRTVIDARRCLDPSRWRAAGWDHQTLGAFRHHTAQEA
ncbi:UDP-glucose dehydrogenase family protein [Streptomyces sp. NPDC088097]|uniref:UDP-glucose dehydrogenase family protein n=1 Tax=Streptomyces sp. NPDC088097 TaxID=3365823 RepID=UPI003814E6DF